MFRPCPGGVLRRKSARREIFQPVAHPRRGSALEVLLQDSFSGEGAIGAHSPEIPGGTPWVIVNESFYELSGGRLNASANNARAVVDLSPQVDIDMQASLYIGANYFSGFSLRYTSNTVYHKLLVNRYSQKLEFYRNTALKASLVYTFSPNTSYSVSLWAFQQRFVAFLEGSYALDYRESVPLALAGKCGYDGGSWAVGSGISELRVVRASGWKRLSLVGDTLSLPGERWPAKVERAYNARRAYIDYRSGEGATLLSQAGNDLDALAAQVIASDQPYAVVVALGAYDSSAEGVQARVEANLNTLGAAFPLARLYCLAPLPCTSGPAYASGSLAGIRAAIATACSATGKASFWDTYSDPWIDPATVTSDGLLPNEQGHERIAARVLERL